MTTVKHPKKSQLYFNYGHVVPQQLASPEQVSFLSTSNIYTSAVAEYNAASEHQIA